MLSSPSNQTPPTYRSVATLATPIVLANLSQPLIGLVDTAIGGHLPHGYQLGAVSLGSTLIILYCWLFGFLKMSTSGFIAQADGSRDHIRRSDVLSRALILALTFTCLILSLHYPLRELGLDWLGAEGELRQNAETYFNIRLFATPAVMLNYVLLGTLIGLGQTKAILKTQLLLNVINLSFDIALVYGLDWEVSGLAWAAVIAEYSALLYSAWLLRFQLYDIDMKRASKLHDFLSSLSVNRDIFLRTLMLQIAFTSITALGTRLGTSTLAANALLLSLSSLQAHTLDGFSHAAEVLCGRAYGAKNKLHFDHAIRICLYYSIAMAFIMTTTGLIFGESIIQLMTNQDSTLQQSLIYLPWLIFLPCTAFLCFLLDGVFIGTTRAREMRNAMFFALLVFSLSAILFVPIFTNHGIWLSLHIFMLSRAAGLYYYFKDFQPLFKTQ